MLNSYITDTHVCSTFTLNESDSIFNYNQLEMMIPKRLMLQFSMKFGQNNIKIFIHNKISKNQMTLSREFVWSGEEELTYEIFTINKLPSPYPSNCLDYTELGYQNKYHAIFDCYDELASKTFNSTCCGSTIKFENQSVIKFTKLSESEVIENQCKSRYPRDDCRIEKILKLKIGR